MRTIVIARLVGLVLFISLVMQINLLLILSKAKNSALYSWREEIILAAILNLILLVLATWFSRAPKEYRGPAKNKKIALAKWAKRVFSAFAISYAFFLLVSVAILLSLGYSSFNKFISSYYLIFIMAIYPIGFYLSCKYLNP